MRDRTKTPLTLKIEGKRPPGAIKMTERPYTILESLQDRGDYFRRIFAA